MTGMSTPEAPAPTLTPALLRALTVLRDQCDEPVGAARIPRGDTYPRAIAVDLWPGSPGLRKRSRRGGSSLGPGLPMAAAKLMWRLAKLGLAATPQTNKWTITRKGRAALEQK